MSNILKNKKLSGKYVAGFVDGEGCFGLQFRKDVRYERFNTPIYYSWKTQFTIVSRSDEMNLFKKIQDLFNCGAIYKAKSDEIHYVVSKTEDLYNIIIPFFKRYSLEGKKKHDFNLWVEAVEIIYKNKRKSTNIKKGVRGFTKTVWDKKDFQRLLKIHKLMQLYKSKRPLGFKHILVAQRVSDRKK